MFSHEVLDQFFTHVAVAVSVQNEFSPHGALFISLKSAVDEPTSDAELEKFAKSIDKSTTAQASSLMFTPFSNQFKNKTHKEFFSLCMDSAIARLEHLNTEEEKASASLIASAGSSASVEVDAKATNQSLRRSALLTLPALLKKMRDALLDKPYDEKTELYQRQSEMHCLAECALYAVYVAHPNMLATDKARKKTAENNSEAKSGDSGRMQQIVTKRFAKVLIDMHNAQKNQPPYTFFIFLLGIALVVSLLILVAACTFACGITLPLYLSLLKTVTAATGLTTYASPCLSFLSFFAAAGSLAGICRVRTLSSHSGTDTAKEFIANGKKLLSEKAREDVDSNTIEPSCTERLCRTLSLG